MSKIELFSKFVPVLLIVSILFAACDVPDISKFTEASAEMTSGIRQGVKETDTILLSASRRDDLFSAKDIGKVSELHTNYQKTLKPTVKVLESIDSYLEALNALALANKKSEENSRAAVNAVGELVSAVSGITFAETTINLAAGVITLLEKLRTEKAFKKRVELVDQIMNGGDANGNKPCTQDPNGILTKKIWGQVDIIDPAVKAAREVFEHQLKYNIAIINRKIGKLKEDKNTSQVEAEKLKIDEKIDKEVKARESNEEEFKAEISNLYAKKIAILTNAQKKKIEDEVGGSKCGVIDLLKYNIEDLRAIHNSVSKKLYNGTRSKNITVISYHNSILANDGRVQIELQHILDYKRLNLRLNESVYLGDSVPKIDEIKLTIKNTTDSIFILDSKLQFKICSTIVRCTAENKIRESEFLTNLSRDNGKITEELEKREVELIEENKRFTADLQRITPAYNQVMAELKQIKDKQKQMDALFESSGEALDTWAETHANLRVTLNTKKPLTVSRLVSKVKEIWSILKPETTE